MLEQMIAVAALQRLDELWKRFNANPSAGKFARIYADPIFQEITFLERCLRQLDQFNQTKWLLEAHKIAHFSNKKEFSEYHS